MTELTEDRVREIVKEEIAKTTKNSTISVYLDGEEVSKYLMKSIDERLRRGHKDN